MDTRKRKENTPTASTSDTKALKLAKYNSLPSIDDALCLDELVYSRETKRLLAGNYLNPDDLYEAYDVLGFFIAEPVQLDIIKDVIEGLNKLLHQENVRVLFNTRTLSAKEVLDRFLYVRTDNDYEFAHTVNDVTRLANILSTPAADALVDLGKLDRRKVVSAFLECSENEFDFKNALAAGRRKEASQPNRLFHHTATLENPTTQHTDLKFRKT